MSTVISDRPDGSRRVSLVFDSAVVEQRRKSNDRKVFYDYYPERSKTKSEFHKDSNINRIMAKYKRTRTFDPLILRDMKYGDFASGSDFAEMSMKVLDANFEFMNLPANVRSRFDNDPGQLLDFLADPANNEESIKLGLRNAPKLTYGVKDGFSIVYKDGIEVERKALPDKDAPAGAPAGKASGADGGKKAPSA